ncbi:MAG: 3-dehydroquinate synthase [Candidatus Rifleibacteriota bacterium]
METQKLSFNRTTTSEILLGNDIFKEIAARVHRSRTAKKCAVITNEVVAKWYLKPLLLQLRDRGFQANEIIIADGEKYKNLETVTQILNRLCELEIDRDCPVIALGGGVTCDITAFAASIYKRGVPLILIPTTLMAMVDACVGGKTGVNLEQGKNLIGTFYQPMLTAIDVAVLKTLPLTQLSYGLVEALKHGAIADAAYFRFIAKNCAAIKACDLSLMQRLIRRSIHIKKSIVLEDELDKGIRNQLNYGHSFGHALESAGNYIRLHHGEAVGLGMLMALNGAAQSRILKEDYRQAFVSILKEFNLPVKIPGELDKNEILHTLCQDKKKDQEGFKFIFPVKIGEVTEFKVPENKITDFLKTLLKKI